jgi:hypothetical protein
MSFLGERECGPGITAFAEPKDPASDQVGPTHKIHSFHISLDWNLAKVQPLSNPCLVCTLRAL